MRRQPNPATSGENLAELSPGTATTSRAASWFWALPKWLIGGTLCGQPAGALLVVGWTQRLMQRSILKTWWRLSPARAGDFRLVQFLELDDTTASQRNWPNWCLGQRPAAPRVRYRWWNSIAGSFGLNFRLGIAASFNTWVLTGPGCFLWATGWYFGWQNSFNKGYENAPYGPVTFSLGMVLFSLAMLHVPLGLARQASTGDWRRFYDFRLIWTLTRRRWLATIGLAVVWSGAAALSVLVKAVPPFVAGYGDRFAHIADGEAFHLARRFYWGAALVLFPLYCGVRIAAARLYARTLVEAYQLGVINEDQLEENEWQALRRLELLTPRTRPRRPALARVAAWLATRSGQCVAVSTVFALWLALSSFNLIGEFVSRTDFSRGWWNLPMIHLPWFDYTPEHLRAAARTTDRTNALRTGGNAAE